MRSVQRRARTAALAVMIAVLIGAVVPSAVLAHAELVSSTPAHGAKLPSPPTEIRLVFSEAPWHDSLSVRLFDRRGTEVALGDPATGPLPTTVIVPIPTELRPGPYTVVWFVVSVEDEHPETKELVFGIGEPSGAPSVTADQLSDATSNTLLPASTLLSILGLTLILGAAVQARFFGLDRPRVARLALVGAAISASALLVKAVGAPRAAATITDGAAGPFSGIGPADLARLALLVVFVSLILATGQAPAGTARRRMWLGGVLAGVGLAWLQAASSHAAGVGILPWVNLAWQGIDVAISKPRLYSWFGIAFEVGRQLNVLVATVLSSRAAQCVTVEGQASQAGRRCDVLAGTDPQSGVTYEIWVGQNDGRIHRLVMGLPGHYMVNAYCDVNEPVDIEPPATAVPAP